MATLRVEEAYTERDETINAKGDVTEIEIPYLVFGAEDESAALSAARGRVKTVAGMALSSIEVVERINADTWKVKAVYEADEDGESPDTDTGDEDDRLLFFGHFKASAGSGPELRVNISAVFCHHDTLPDLRGDPRCRKPAQLFRTDCDHVVSFHQLQDFFIPVVTAVVFAVLACQAGTDHDLHGAFPQFSAFFLLFLIFL